MAKWWMDSAPAVESVILKSLCERKHPTKLLSEINAFGHSATTLVRTATNAAGFEPATQIGLCSPTNSRSASEMTDEVLTRNVTAFYH